MTTRTKQLLQRSRDLLERSRVAAVQLLEPPRNQTAALPRIIEGSRESMVHQEPEGAVVDICASIALRDLNLVDSLLSLLERMEESEADPDRLTELYKLDHLAARLRRNAENLRVLAGRDASDTLSESASLVDVIRAAMSSIDGYSRVSIGRVLTLGVVGIAADDLSRLLAELLDNAAKQSPPDTSVRVSAYLTDSGSVLMRIEDDGIGLPSERVAELNSRLSDEPKLNDDSVRHMGLAVVRRLAARHEMRVRLDRRSPHGTTATVLLPAPLLCDLPDNAWSGSQTVVLPAATTARAATGHTVPAARRPSSRPRHAAEHSATTAGGLPKRNPPGGRVATRPPAPQDPAEGGRTVNGLPRRVSRSIKNPDHGDDSAPVPPALVTPQDEKAGHEQLLADLDAFAAGEQDAKDAAWPAGTDPDAPPATAEETVAPTSAAEPAPEFEAPAIETPEVVTPEAETAQFETPDLETPELKTAQVETPGAKPPDLTTSRVETPRVEGPDLKAPELETPGAETPGAETPDLTTPQVETARVEAPELEAERAEAARGAAPELEASRVETARVEPPDLTTSRVETARVETPELEAPELEPPERETTAIETPEAETAPERADEPVAESGFGSMAGVEPDSDFGAAPPYAQADDRPAAQPPRPWERPGYVPDSVFDTAAEDTPTPPHGFPLPADPDTARAPERGHDQPGGPTT
jgi:two-component sensor histidine kinase